MFQQFFVRCKGEEWLHQQRAKVAKKVWAGEHLRPFWGVQVAKLKAAKLVVF